MAHNTTRDGYRAICNVIPGWLPPSGLVEAVKQQAGAESVEIKPVPSEKHAGCQKDLREEIRSQLSLRVW